MNVSTLAVWAVCALSPQEGLHPPSPDDIALVNGQAVSVEAYGAWLLERHGWEHLQSFLELVALRQDADARGITLTDADLAEACDRDWSDQVLLRFSGDEAKFIEALAQGGLTPAGYRRRRMVTLETEELTRRLVLATREPTEERLRAVFAEEFPGGMRRHLQVAFFNRFEGFTPSGQPDRDLLARLDAKAMDRATAFRDAVAAEPERFGELVQKQSDANLLERYDRYKLDLRESGGVLERARPTHLLGVMEPSLKKASTGDLLEPIKNSRGVYVVHAVAIEPVTFDDVRDEVETIFRTRRPTAQELHFYRAQLMERAEVQRNENFRVPDADEGAERR